MKVQLLPISTLKPNPDNPRLIKDDKFKKLVASIQSLPAMLELRPIVVNAELMVLGGNMRLKACQAAGLKEVPVVIADALTEAQQAEFVIKDNVSFGDWEWDTLANAWDAADLTAWGLDVPPVDVEVTVGLTDPDDVPDAPAEPITKHGDRIVLGRHVVMCGDSTSFEHVETLTGGAVLQMVYTDPPYGISIVQGGSVGGGKLAAVGSYATVIGDDSTQTAVDAYNLCAALNVPVIIFWGGNYYASALPDSSCWVVWDKENSGNFADAELAWTNQKTAVRVFRHLWNGMIKGSERGEKRVHPTQKPVALAVWCFEQYGKATDNVLDLFGGSGSTLIAAEKTGRTCYTMELSPAYCDVIVRRWEEFTGQKAVRPTP